MNKSKQGNEARQALAESAGRLAALEGAVHKTRVVIEHHLRGVARKLKGTGDMTEVAAEARLATKIEIALRGPDAPMSLVELARKLAVPAGRVQRVLTHLRDTPCPTRSVAYAPDARQIYNHGTSDDPRWAWVIGDLVEAPVLTDAIEAMLRRRPYTFAELLAATGARRGRISGATVEFARSDLPIWTVGGSDRKYRWFIGQLSQLPATDRKHAKRVRLAPDKNKV